MLGGAGLAYPNTTVISPIRSTLGRLSLRVGTSVQSGNLALTPFFTASVFHEFAGNVTSNFATCSA